MSILAAQAIILDPNATSAERLSALDEVPNQGPGFYLLRSVLMLDRDATLRARAAERLAIREAEALLVEAAEDPMPLVRRAAIASLARIGAGASIVRSALLEDPIWWVRRAAAYAMTAIGGPAAEALIGALDDPFWRVRHAAVQSLVALAGDDLSLQAELTALRGQTASAQAALERLRRALGGEVGPAPDAPPARPNGVLFNEDPAVMTARLEDPSFRAPIAELIELVPSSHAALRRLVIARLAKADERALRAVTAWLEDPRLPHAVEAVLQVLEKSDGARAVAEAILADAEAGERARAWAIAWIGSVGLSELSHAVREATSHYSPLIRAVACESSAKLGFAPPAELLDDPDERVALAAVSAYADVQPAFLSARPFEGSRETRRRLFEAADRVNDRDRFREAALDPDPYLRAAGLGALARAGLLSSRDQFCDPDPWIRLAVLSREHFEAALDDPDLEVRRAVLDRMRPGTVEAHRAAKRMMAAPDPILRVRAAELTDDHEALLALTMDRSPAVRSAAAERLQGVDVRPILAVSSDPKVRKAAFTRLFGTGEIERALPHESGEVRAHLEAMLIPFRETAPLAPHEPRWQEPVSNVEKRPLGRTGMMVSPLAISGAFDLSPGSLLHAFKSGVNLFFWEPRYGAMTRFLRADAVRRDRLHVIAGSFHGSVSAVEADVDRALSLLRTDRIDVFLLFWVRSRERLSDELYQGLSRLKDAGKIRAFGFSTHDRKLACSALIERGWDVIMTRHNAAHIGAEEHLFPTATETETGVLGFSALCYGRLLAGEGAPSPAECYRYSLSAGASAVISAPRRHRELEENLSVLAQPMLDAQRIEDLRAHGRAVYAGNKDWAQLIRRVPDVYENLQRSLLDAPESPSIAGDSELR